MITTFAIADPQLAAKVSGRKLIFLDTNTWIDLADEKTPKAKALRAKLVDLVASGKIFCPVSWALIDELFKQNYDSAMRVASLMDELGLGLTFVLDDEVFTKEIETYVANIVNGTTNEVTAEDLLVPILGHVGSTVRLIYPSDAPATFVAETTKAFAQLVSSRSISDYITLAKDFLPRGAGRAIKVPAYKEAWQAVAENTKGNKEEIRRREEDAMTRQVFLPKFRELVSKLPLASKMRLLNHYLALPKDKHGTVMYAVLTYLPALENSIVVHTMTDLAPKQDPTMNDFYDQQMLRIPLAYCDAVVAPDRWIRHMVTSFGSLFGARHAKYVGSLNAFDEYLDSLG